MESDGRPTRRSGLPRHEFSPVPLRVPQRRGSAPRGSERVQGKFLRSLDIGPLRVEKEKSAGQERLHGNGEHLRADGFLKPGACCSLAGNYLRRVRVPPRALGYVLDLVG